MIEAGYEYEMAQAVEIMFPADAGGPYRHWTGDGSVTLEGNVYTPGKILSTEGITTPAEIGADPTAIALDTVLVADRDIFIAKDRGPVDAKLMYIWRKRPVGGSWQAWAVGAVQEGRLDIGTYQRDQIAINIQRVYDDVWRGPFPEVDRDRSKAQAVPEPGLRRDYAGGA